MSLPWQQRLCTVSPLFSSACGVPSDGAPHTTLSFAQAKAAPKGLLVARCAAQAAAHQAVAAVGAAQRQLHAGGAMQSLHGSRGSRPHTHCVASCALCLRSVPARRRPAAFQAASRTTRVAVRATAEPEAAPAPRRAAREVTVDLQQVSAGDSFTGKVVSAERVHALG